MFSANKTRHGGDTRIGMRKVARPLATDGRFMHVVFRSTQAVGEKDFRYGDNYQKIREILDFVGRKTGVELGKFRNVGNHFHFLIRSLDANSLRRFLKLFPQKVALYMTGAKKGHPKGRFFDLTPFSRIVEWGRDYATVIRYFIKNGLEEIGHSKKEVKALYHFLCTDPANQRLFVADMYYRGETIFPPNRE